MLHDKDEITLDLHDSYPLKAVREAIEIVYGRMWERDCESAKLIIKYAAHSDKTIDIERAQIFVNGFRVYGDRKKIEAECAAWLDTELRAQAKREVDNW